MSDKINAQNILAFVLEIAALVLYGLWARSLTSVSIWSWVLFLSSFIAFATLWGLFLAPKAPRRLHMPWLLVGKFALLLLPGLLYFQKNILYAIAWAVLVLLHLIFGAVQKSL